MIQIMGRSSLIPDTTQTSHLHVRRLPFHRFACFLVFTIWAERAELCNPSTQAAKTVCLAWALRLGSQLLFGLQLMVDDVQEFPLHRLEPRGRKRDLDLSPSHCGQDFRRWLESGTSTSRPAARRFRQVRPWQTKGKHCRFVRRLLACYEMKACTPLPWTSPAEALDRPQDHHEERVGKWFQRWH